MKSSSIFAAIAAVAVSAALPMSASAAVGYWNERAESASVRKDGWRRLDPGKYAALDDMAFFKALVSIDFDGSYVKEVEKAGGLEKLCAKYKDVFNAEKRAPFYNLLYLKDALVEMGASHEVVMAVLGKASRSHQFKRKMSIKDVAGLMPELAGLYGDLDAMDAPPKEIAEIVFRDFINESEESRTKKLRKIHETAARYVAVRRVVVAAGVSRNDANAGMAPFVFKYTSDVPRRKFSDNEETFSRIQAEGLDGLAADCRHIVELFAPLGKPVQDVVGVLIAYMATPVGRRTETLQEIETMVKTFAEHRGNSNDAAAGLHARERAFKAARRRDDRKDPTSPRR